LIEEEHVVTSAFVSVEIEGLEIPTDSSVSRIAKQTLKNRILSCDKSCGCAQHLGAQESAAKEPTLTDLPRCP
jgi:hypothetical protein